jgi:2-phosphoglycolate phosphatase
VVEELVDFPNIETEPAPRRVERYSVDAIIFDFDGVLVDTAEDIAVAANAVLSRYGEPAVSLDRARRGIGGGAEALMRYLLPDRDGDTLAEAAALFKAEYGRAFAVHTLLYPGVRDVLEGFITAGVVMAIATNKTEPITRGLVAEFGLEPYFSAVVGPESVTRRKPEPEAIEQILARVGIPPARAVMVGDSAVDIMAGNAAGTGTCGALYGYGTEADIVRAAPDFVIRSLAELPHALDVKPGCG